MYYENTIVYGDRECLESHRMQSIKYTTEDTYFKITPELENRLDLVSYKFYGTVRFWWVIAIASDIFNPLDVPVGSMVRIPPLSTIYYVKGSGI